MKSLFLNILELSVTTGVLILLLSILQKLWGQRIKSATRYFIWIVILLRLLVPVESDYGIIKYYRPMGTASQGDASVRSFDSFGFLANLWLWIAVLIFIYRMLSYFVFLYRQKKTRRIYNIVESSVPVYICSIVKTPLLSGLIAPKILLPYEIDDVEELKLMLAHELYHRKRLDLWVKFIDNVVKCVYWFNPFVYLLSYELTLTMEMSCDEAVLKGKHRDIHIAYAEMMLKVMKGNFSSVYVPMTTGFSYGFSQVKERFSLILSNSAKRRCLFIVIVVIILAVLSGTVFGISIVNAPVPESPSEDEVPAVDDVDTSATVAHDTIVDTIGHETNNTAKAGTTETAYSKSSIVNETSTDKLTQKTAETAQNSYNVDTSSAAVTIDETPKTTSDAVTETVAHITELPKQTAAETTATSTSTPATTAKPVTTAETTTDNVTTGSDWPFPEPPPDSDTESRYPMFGMLSDQRTVKLTFDANGGICLISLMDVTSGVPVGTLPSATRDGYRFDGWWIVDSDGNMIACFTENSVPQKNMTLVAKWVEI